MTKKKIMISYVTILIIATLMLLGLTYAYYRTRIIGNPDKESVFVQTKKLEIVYQNESAVITANGIEPSYNAIKTFEVKNNGDEKVKYSIMLDNVENTFSRINDWTFILKEGETILKSGIVPQTESYIEYSEEIAAGETKSYTLEINYANADEDQSVDMGSSLSLRININEEVGETFNKAEPNTLLAAIGRDNIISEPLTIPGKEASKGTLYEEGNLDEEIYNLSIFNSYASRYWVYGTGYEFDSTTGKYTLTGVKIGVYSDIYNELNEKYLISPNAYYNSALTEEEAANLNTSNLSTLYKVVSAKSNGITYKIKEAAIAIQGEALFAVTEDDYGDSYYFRGIVENNYVNFSGMCWRIVRVVGNGDIKLVLADENGYCNAETYSINNTKSALIDGRTDFKYFNTDVEKTEELVYNYSNIAELLMIWANKKDLVSSNKISYNPTLCVDTSEIDTGGVFGIEYAYGAYGRLNLPSSAKPTLKCATTLEEDPNILGIEILNADEVAFAGSANATNSNFYLNTNANGGNYCWTSSPSTIEKYDIESYVNFWAITTYGSLESSDVEWGGSIRPAVILASSVTITSGNGTIINPYTID